MLALGRVLRSVAATAAVAAVCVPAAAVATVDPGLDWQTISTDHFDVHFHQGAEWTGSEAARIAEEIYRPITELYGYEPGRCHLVILDTEDYANGAAYFYDNKIEIWATNLEFHLRGTTQWLRNVITHEFAHIVSIQAAMKMPRRIPAIYFQAVDFETEKRPDVITGYPDLIVSYPITGTVVPAWWAEGVAQYQSPSLQTDCWDTHRDMILRCAVVEDRMLTYDEMGFLGHRSLENEEVYDHGFGLVRYIASTYGPRAIERVSNALGKWNRLTIDGALEHVTGKSGDELYTDWKASVRDRFDRMLVDVGAHTTEGEVLSDEGFMTLYPSFAPDGRCVALLSNKGSDFAATSLYLVDREKKKLERVAAGVSSRAVFSPDGSTLLYAKHTRADAYGARLSDLYAYTIATKKEKRLTRKLRASEPQWSPDGRSIVCVVNRDGTHRLVAMDGDGSAPRDLYVARMGTQLYAPQYGPGGERVLFGVFTTGTRDVASIAAGGGDFRYEIRSPNDERDARWTPDGGGIVFASDRSGIFNVYRVDVATGEVAQLTNVVGGAFMPDVERGGTLVYSQYTAQGYRAMTLAAGAEAVATLTRDAYATRAAGEFDECTALKGAQLAGDAVGAILGGSAVVPGFEGGASTVGSARPGATGTADAVASEDEAGAAAIATGADPPGPAVQKYDWSYTGFQFFPRFVLWDGTPRLGLFIANNEVMDRQPLFFGGSYGTDGEFDLVFDFELRRLFPVVFMEYYKVRQKYEDQFPLEELDRYYYVDYRYDVWSADLGVRLEFEEPYSLTRRNDVALWWNHSEYNIFIEPSSTPLGDPGAEPTPEQPVGWKYFIGNDARARWSYKSIARAVDSDINPRGGREFSVEVMYAMDDLASGDFEYGVNPIYLDYDFGQYTVDWREYLALPGWRHSLQVRLMGSVIDNTVDDFFWVYMGGMDRLRGYTYYAIGGQKGALASATYRFPIWRAIDRQASWLTFKDVYGGVFYEIGSAWTRGNLPSDDPSLERDYYSSVGGELRLNLGSFYSYPATVGIAAAYALDSARYVNPIFDVPPVDYEPQWSWYFNVGFGF